MSICSTTNVHYVVGVEVQRRRFSDFSILAFTFTNSEGQTVTVEAFSAEPLQLIDAPEVPANSCFEVQA